MSKYSSVFKYSFVLLICAGFFQVSRAGPVVRGNDVGHGGNSVICGNDSPVVLDYYNATLGTLGGSLPTLVDLSGLTADQTIQLIRKQLIYRFNFLDALDKALANIGPMTNCISTDLKQVDDSDEPYYLPAGCALKTAAIRQDPFQMYGDPSVINAMAPSQQGLLMLHEAFYLMAASHGATTSTSVRNFMRAVLVKNPVPAILDSTISDLGEMATSYEGSVHPQSGIYSWSDSAQSSTSAPVVRQYQVAVDVATSQIHVINSLNGFPVDVIADCSHYNVNLQSLAIDCTVPSLADGTQITFSILQNGHWIRIVKYPPGTSPSPQGTELPPGDTIDMSI